MGKQKRTVLSFRADTADTSNHRHLTRPAATGTSPDERTQCTSNRTHPTHATEGEHNAEQYAQKTSRQANEGKTEKQQGLWPERDAGRDPTETPERHMQKPSNSEAITHQQSPGQCESTESWEPSRRLSGRDR